MAKSTSFEGIRVAVKVDTQTWLQVERAAKEHSKEAVVRQWIYNWRTLANLSPFLYERLVYAASQRRVDLTALVNEALTLYCSNLPPVPEGKAIVTPVTVIEPTDDTPDEAPEPEPKQRSSKKR